MQRLSKQSGFALVPVVLVIVMAGIIAFVAWRVIEVAGDADIAQKQAQSTSAAPSGDVPVVTDSNDLSNLENQLNTTQIDDSTAAELETQTTF